MLTFDAWKSDGHRHQPVPTGAKLVPVVVEVPDEADRQANREADEAAAFAKSTCGCSNRGWRRLLLYLRPSERDLRGQVHRSRLAVPAVQDRVLAACEAA